MPERVIYCALSCASLLVPGHYGTLSHVNGAAVVSLSDDAMRTLVAKAPDVPILYFNKPDYDEALRGLNEPEAHQVIEARLRNWSPKILDYSLIRITEDERRCLTLIAVAMQEHPERRNALSPLADSAFDLLTQLAKIGSDESRPVADLLFGLIDKEATLIVELDDVSEIRTRTDFQRALSLEFKRYGRPQFAQAPPHVERMRGVWLAPADAALMSYLTDVGGRNIPWKGGVVATIAERDIQSLVKSGKKAEVLFFAEGDFLRDGEELPISQLTRQYAAMEQEGAAGLGRRKQQYLNNLRLSVALQRRALRLRVTSSDPLLAGLLEGQVAIDSRILLREAAATKPWIGPSYSAPKADRLASAENDAADDIALLLDIARARKDGFIVEKLAPLQQTKQAALRHLPGTR